MGSENLVMSSSSSALADDPKWPLQELPLRFNMLVIHVLLTLGPWDRGLGCFGVFSGNQSEWENHPFWMTFFGDWWQLKYFFWCSPRNLGKMNPFWPTNSDQMGWFNHQLVLVDDFYEGGMWDMIISKSYHPWLEKKQQLYYLFYMMYFHVFSRFICGLCVFFHFIRGKFDVFTSKAIPVFSMPERSGWLFYS